MDRQKKWRLILGKQADPEGSVGLEAAHAGVDGVLEALYDSDRKGGLGASSPNVNRWLGDIRKYFPASVVQVMQKDALDRLHLHRLLTEPELLEMVEPDVSLVATLVSLNKVMPSHTRETARAVIKKVVDELEKRLRNPLEQAIKGTLSRSVPNRHPRLREINWRKTIQANLKNYQPDYKTIIPEILKGFGRKGHSLKEVFLLIDQSGSMAGSLVYASVFGAVMASMRSLKTRFIVFDTNVVDLTENLDDPVELLFGVQLGGGTDINRALGYAEKRIQTPADTILLLISDLFEGGNRREMIRRVAGLKNSGVHLVVLLALDDQGAPAFDRTTAADLAALGIPAFACSPDRFPELMEAAIKKEPFSAAVEG